MSQNTSHEPKTSPFDNFILNNQLNLIAGKLKTLYQKDQAVSEQLQSAIDLLKNGKISESADLLHVSLLGNFKQF